MYGVKIYKLSGKSISEALKESEEIWNNGSVLQNPFFARLFYKNRAARCFLLYKNNTVVASCVTTELLHVAEIQFGPLGNDDKDIIELLTLIISFYKKRWYASIRFCFPNEFTSGLIESKIDYLKKKFSNCLLTVRGHWSTYEIDLSRDESKILSGYSGNHRRDIEKAVRQGLVVEKITQPEKILLLAEVIDNTYRFRKIKAQWGSSVKMFPKWFQVLEKFNRVYWYGIFNGENRLLGGILLIIEKNRLIYQMGAADPEFRKQPVLHLCLHHALLQAKKEGFGIFDFGGCDKEAKAGTQTFYINMFKRHFGGEIKSYSPLYELRLNSLVFGIHKIVWSLKNKIL